MSTSRLTLTNTERAALRAFAEQQGRIWRAVLRDMYNAGRSSWWGTATRPDVLGPLLDRIGPDALSRITPADLVPRCP